MLILVAHGSRNEGWRAPLTDLARSLDERLESESVRVAFMQFTGPTLREVVEAGIREGEAEFRILPLFVASAGHVEKDVRPLVDALATSHPQAHLELLTPVGEDPLFLDLILGIAHRSPGGSRPPQG